MFSFDKACEVALYAMHDQGVPYIADPIDIGAEWVFKPYDPEHTLIGPQPVAVNKKTGGVRIFRIPDKEHFDQLAKGIPWDLPGKYQCSERNTLC